jgi:hypothetical protein
MLHARYISSFDELSTPWSVTGSNELPRASRDSCLVVAVTADDRAVMLKHSHPSRLRFPGDLQRPGEGIEACARRVLLQGAGFDCAEIESLGLYDGVNIVYGTGAGLATLPSQVRVGQPLRLLAPFGQLSHWVGADGFNAAPHALALGLAAMYRARLSAQKVELAVTDDID